MRYPKKRSGESSFFWTYDAKKNKYDTAAQEALFFRRKVVLKSAMALFGDAEGDVGPFVMTEDGEEWFPFTLDNLEMDRGCTSLGQDSNPMEQVRYSSVSPG